MNSRLVYQIINQEIIFTVLIDLNSIREQLDNWHIYLANSGKMDLLGRNLVGYHLIARIGYEFASLKWLIKNIFFHKQKYIQKCMSTGLEHYSARLRYLE